METLRTIFDPDFLLRYAVYTNLLVGLGCPLVGVFLVLRRLIFMGVALPQISSTGVAVALSLPLWMGWEHAAHQGEREHGFAIIGSVVASVLAILVLAFLERRHRGLSEGRLGTAYAVATAVSILLLSKNAIAELGWLDLLKGEIIAISGVDLTATLATFCLVLVTLWVFHKELLLVSFDRAMAVTLRKNVVVWDLVLYLLIGLTVSSAVLSVGPLVAFGFLVIPVLTARVLAANMRQFFVFSSLIGGATALVGFCVAYRFDFPVGPTDVALSGVVYAAAFTARRIFGFFTSRSHTGRESIAVNGLAHR